MLMTVPPERVFEVLTDPTAYGEWVVGAHSVRGADDRWPDKGSRFHHRVGGGPFTLRDHTEVVDIVVPRRLQLRARARPFGTAMVTVEVQRDGDGGSRVLMTEDGADPFTRLALGNPVSQRLLFARNAESLRRLKRLVEQPSA